LQRQLERHAEGGAAGIQAADRRVGAGIPAADGRDDPGLICAGDRPRRRDSVHVCARRIRKGDRRGCGHRRHYGSDNRRTLPNGHVLLLSNDYM
jgi:hypothetical protein